MDRCCYWRARGVARSRGLEIVLIQDGMDQSKFTVPRSALMRAKLFESMNRPRLHLAAVICHGRFVAIYLSESDVAKDSNTSCEIFAHVLHELSRSGVDLSACRDAPHEQPRVGLCNTIWPTQFLTHRTQPRRH